MQVHKDEVKTILIADDDVWLRDMPDLILLDVGLPGRSGLSVMEDLRTTSATCAIPVMLVSGETNLIETGHARDANAAFHKPLDFAAFLAKIHDMTRGENTPAIASRHSRVSKPAQGSSPVPRFPASEQPRRRCTPTIRAQSPKLPASGA